MYRFMRIKPLTKRILCQMIHDKRTLALILIAPIAVLTLIYFILQSENKDYSIGVIHATDAFIEQLQDNEDYNINIEYMTESEVEDAIKDDRIAAAIDIRDNLVSDSLVSDNNVSDNNISNSTVSGNDVFIYISGADSGVASKLQILLKTTYAKTKQDELKISINDFKESFEKIKQNSGIDTELDFDTEDINYHVDYVTGQEGGTLFDKFGTQLIGIIVYFFVFLIAGIQFLTERTSGTLEKILSTPMRRWEIILGYLLGFGIMAILQSSLITFFVVYVLGLSINGSIWYVLLITLLTAINALSLGILLSTIANSEFQMIQFIPIIILPQIFLCGLFQISGFWSKLGYIMPLHYTSHAITEVMIKGNGWSFISQDVFILTALLIFFVTTNVLLLKKQREI